MLLVVGCWDNPWTGEGYTCIYVALVQVGTRICLLLAYDDGRVFVLYNCSR